MTINYYIVKLLLSRDGLVIPGLGSFSVRERSARIDKSKNIIVPPGKEYVFNSKISEDSDEILANTIAREEDISFEEAKKLIDVFVSNVKEKIDQQDQYELKNTGYFFKDSSGNINFSKYESSDLSSGLKEMEAAPFELIPGLKQPPSSKARSEKNKRQKKTTGRKKTIKKIIVSLAALFVVLILAFFVWYFDLYENMIPEKKKQVTVENQKSAKKKENEQKDTSAAKLDQVIDKMTDKKKALMYEPESKKEQKDKDSDKYYLVAGSFKLRKNADKYVNQLEDKGFNPKILEGDNLYRITIRSYDNKEDAIVALYQMRDKGKVKSIWLLTVPGKDSPETSSH